MTRTIGRGNTLWKREEKDEKPFPTDIPFNKEDLLEAIADNFHGHTLSTSLVDKIWLYKHYYIVFGRNLDHNHTPHMVRFVIDKEGSALMNKKGGVLMCSTLTWAKHKIHDDIDKKKNAKVQEWANPDVDQEIQIWQKKEKKKRDKRDLKLKVTKRRKPQYRGEFSKETLACVEKLKDPSLQEGYVQFWFMTYHLDNKQYSFETEHHGKKADLDTIFTFTERGDPGHKIVGTYPRVMERIQQSVCISNGEVQYFDFFEYNKKVYEEITEKLEFVRKSNALQMHCPPEEYDFLLQLSASREIGEIWTFDDKLLWKGVPVNKEPTKRKNKPREL